MIPLEYYKTAYFACLAFILIVFLLPVLLRKPIEYPIQSQNNSIVILLLILSVLFIGLRDPTGPFVYLGDTSSYTRTFESIQNGQRTEFTKDIGFYLFMKLFTLFTSVKVFYIVCAFLYTYLPYLSFKKQFGPLSIYVFIAYLNKWVKEWTCSGYIFICFYLFKQKMDFLFHYNFINQFS